jgi:hypothetical protein
MHKAKIVLFTFLLFNFFSCDKLDNRDLLVKNNSDKPIFSILSGNDAMNDGPFYYEYTAEFSESQRGDYDSPFLFQEIKKGQTLANSDRPRYWENYFNELEDKKARVFIVEKDSVDKYGSKTIFSRNIYSEKYLLTPDELEKLDWTIAYNGK